MPAHPAPGSPSHRDVPTDRQICHYIAEMCAELLRLGRRPRFRTINYLLDMARLESERTHRELSD